MGWLNQLTRHDEESAYDTYEDTIEDEVVCEFDRVSVEFGFVRGNRELFMFDAYTGRVNTVDDTSFTHRVSDGISATDRNGVAIERLYRVVGGQQHWRSDHGPEIRPEVEQVGEVTTANVSYRDVQQRRPMYVKAVGERPVTRRADTNEIVDRSRFLDDTEYRIGERPNSERQE